MSRKYDKLKSLLLELFQLDQPDLDFGLYRVMRARSAEVTQFLDHDLLPQVRAAFAHYQSADRVELEQELAKVVASVEAAGLAPEDSPKVQELRERLKSQTIDVAQLEGEVYEHLYSFFRRYYSDGDFLAKRVYKAGVYAIPYEGEEVTLHWANKDQYYIKTSEYLRDYAFRLRPENEAEPMRVHFRLVDATEGEHGNVKVTVQVGGLFEVGDRLSGQFCANHRGQVVQHVLSSQSRCPNHAQHSLDVFLPTRALASKTRLPPDHSAPKSPLCSVVRGLYSVSV